MIIYATKSYLITLVAGFVAFCAFYFSYGFNDNEFQFGILPVLRALWSAALLYLVGYLAGIAVYAAANKIKRKKPNHP
jgi:ABC-type multidrug transport system permease subunit